jgi:hypothetical protein
MTYSYEGTPGDLGKLLLSLLLISLLLLLVPMTPNNK